jgi:hypothetical protein
MRSAGAVALIALIVALVAACAPREAGYELSERAASAPPSTLIPTVAFDAPMAEGVAGTLRLDEDRAALAARAEALRGRAASLSATQPISTEDRARLEATRPEG